MPYAGVYSLRTYSFLSAILLGVFGSEKEVRSVWLGLDGSIDILAHPWEVSTLFS